MNKFMQLSENDRKTIFSQVSRRNKLAQKIVEKDWWVTMALRALLSCECADHIVFKGGTSLSKAWNLIERFSEDIDIAIDRKFFGFEGELKKKQINNLRRASCTYISGALKNEFDNKLRELGIVEYTLSVAETQDSTKDPQIIEIQYNSLFPANNYIMEKVLMEIGARSLIEPSQTVKLRSLLAETLPDTAYSDDFFDVPTVIPQRTFLEKAFLLHEEFQKPFDKVRIDRMTRHIYDLEKLMDTNFATEALNNKELYNAIVEHRRTLTAMKEVDYSTHSPKTINFVPPDFVVDKWRDDYKKMGNMIYGESLPFDKLIERIKELNERFRKIEL
ncbi:MAG: nucleotidyl transferase AbiEii/AbiGii toxin family protein [Bacteroidales bacterium]|nr:nucleotidyl transferase AbiEii/AbiGii toxin family protein [Bacteroidales bacterium]